MRVFLEKDDFGATTHYILYTRAMEGGGKKGEGGNLAENRKAQWLGSTEKEKEGRKGEKRGRGEGRDEGRKRREAKDKREIFSYVVGISLLLIP